MLFVSSLFSNLSSNDLALFSRVGLTCYGHIMLFHVCFPCSVSIDREFIDFMHSLPITVYDHVSSF